MIAVSKAWAAAQNEVLLPEMFVEITYSVTEPGLDEDATVSGTHEEDFSDASQLVGGDLENIYATLDYGAWGLDGGYGYEDGTPDAPGYVTEVLSDADGYFTEYPTLRVDFGSRHDMLIPGISITWSKALNGWATDFRVTAYNANTVVAQKTVTGNTELYTTVWVDLVGYTTITIEILRWSHPYQRVRVSGIELGVQSIYTKTDLTGFTHTQSADLLSATLPKNEITFKLRNDDDRWNPDLPTGKEKYLLEQQEIRVRYGMELEGNIEWIDGGIFWLSEWNTPANGLEATFTARDAIGFMGDEYTGPRSGSLYDLAIEAFEQANLSTLGDGSAQYKVDESLRDIATDFSEDGSEYTIAEMLQMIAHAGCCVFYQDRRGVIHIESRPKKYSGYMIEPRISYSHPEYELSKPVRSIVVEYGTERQTASVAVGVRGEIQTVNNPLIIAEERALAVGESAKEILQTRKTVSGEFRADLRLDALDNIIVASKYASNVLGITDVEYSITGGAFRGKYTGRVVTVNITPTKVYSNEFYSGEVW